MAYTNSSLVTYTKRSPHHSGQRTHSIDRITPHCVVGQCTAETLGEVFNGTRDVSANYGIDKTGRVGLYVDERNRSWCSSSRENDQRAITIECASDTTEPYAFRDVVYKRLIELCADICRRNGKNKLIWFGDKTKTLNYTPKSDEMILTVHRWFSATACPGTWMMNRMGDLAKQVTAVLQDGKTSGRETGTQPVTQPVTQPAAIKEGATVSIKPSAEKYNPTTGTIPAWVKTDYNHIVTQTTVNGKTVTKGGKTCVLLGKKIKKKGGSVEAGINTWVAVDNLTVVETAVTGRVYTVVKGDTLWLIAQKQLGNGNRYPEIVRLNDLKTNVIYSGQKLKLPEK